MSVRRVAAAALVVVLASGATGCGEEEAAPLPRETAANGTVFNSADATFARDLLVQRAREFALIDLTVGRPLDPALTSFLDEARTVRAGEIDQVTTWLTDWGREVPATIRDHAAAHEGAHHFEAIEAAPDADFSEVWIAAFRKELQASGAIASAEKHGAFKGATALAGAVRRVNEAETRRLTELAG